MRLRLTDTVINPTYFISYVRGAQAVIDYLREVNHGATRDSINTEQLLAMPVALPPFNEQKRIIQELDRFMAVVQSLETVIDDTEKRAKRLRQSILKEAFAGRLVPQDADDEPASVLLARIRQARSPKPAQAKLL